jgi:hypothetical protein
MITRVVPAAAPARTGVGAVTAAITSAAFAACSLCGACDATRTNAEPAPMASSVPVSAPVLPADHLAPGELLEGTEQAFGVTLPEGMHVDDTFATVIYASGPMTLKPLVDYFRGHLQGGDLSAGEWSATFEHVFAPGKSEPPLSVHIGTARDVVRVEIRDETPPELPPLPDDPARYRRAGLTPTGRVLDPTHLD